MICRLRNFIPTVHDNVVSEELHRHRAGGEGKGHRQDDGGGNQRDAGF